MKCWYEYGVECKRKGDCEGCEVVEEWDRRRKEMWKREEGEEGEMKKGEREYE